jgi:hypothetical protein
MLNNLQYVIPLLLLMENEETEAIKKERKTDRQRDRQTDR